MAGEAGHRSFYDFKNEECKENDVSSVSVENSKELDKLLRFVADSIIGKDRVFSSPYGPRRVVYCDHIASGRSLKFIEDYILNEVLAHYGSTHTTTSVTALQTTLFRHEARDIIRNATRASEHDRVLFIGNGATGAFHKLIHAMNLSAPPVIFVGPYAHHSSLLPWREIGAKVVRINETATGEICLDHLESELLTHQGGPQLIGCFAAASNVTGIITDDVAITVLLHRYNCLAFWDYATAAPYVDIEMNPICSSDVTYSAHKDAVFFSMHKFLGGVQTPGVLIAKKTLFKSHIPEVCGGGTVFFVSRDSHRYLKDIEMREEGGTPAVVESVRAGLVMQLKMNLTPSFIMERCHYLNKKLIELAKQIPELVVLGNVDMENRLPVLSFLARHVESGRLLHHNFLSAVLNDVFGIQSRGGCACAGPYAQDLLGISEPLAVEYEKLLLEDTRLDRSHLRRTEEHSSMEVLRPGFVRLNLPYTASENQVDFILKAIQEVCKHGWKLLPQYIFNPETAEFKHHSNLVFRERQWLQNISYAGGKFSAQVKCTPLDAPSFEDTLNHASQIFHEAPRVAQRMKISEDAILFEGKAEKLRWFLLPSEVYRYFQLEFKSQSVRCFGKSLQPFEPPVYPLSEEVLSHRTNFVWEARDISNVTRLVQHSMKENQNSLCQVNHNGPEEVVALENKVSSMADRVLVNIDPNSLEEQKNVADGKRNGEILCEGLKCIMSRDDSLLSCKKFLPVKWHPPPKKIFNLSVEAIEEYQMIQPGDRVLMCLSGGKDSLSLLHTLHQYQFCATSRGVPFTLGAVTIDPKSASYDPRPLIPYLDSLGVPYFFEQQEILQQAFQVKELNSICSFCSRMKRGRIYATARREGYNVLAFAHHLDDLAESFLMSVFHNGRLRTMKSCYTVREGDLRVIRPFAFVREKDLRNFAEIKKLPVIPENCPACFETPKERHRVKQMLAQQEVLFPHLYWSLRTAMLPLMGINVTGIENLIFGKNGKVRLNIKNGSKVSTEDLESE